MEKDHVIKDNKKLAGATWNKLVRVRVVQEFQGKDLAQRWQFSHTMMMTNNHHNQEQHHSYELEQFFHTLIVHHFTM